MKEVTKIAYDIIRFDDIEKLEKMIESKKYYYAFRDEMKDILTFCIEFQYFDATKLIVELVDEDYIYPVIPFIQSMLLDSEIFKLFVDTYFDNILHEEFIPVTFYENSEKNLQYLLETINRKKFDEIILDDVLVRNAIFKHQYGYYTFKLFIESDIIDLYNGSDNFIQFVISIVQYKYSRPFDDYIKLIFKWYDDHGFMLPLIKAFKDESLDYKKYFKK